MELGWLTKNPVHPAPNTSKAAIPIIQPLRPELRILRPFSSTLLTTRFCKIVAEIFSAKPRPVPTSDNTLEWNKNADATANLQKNREGAGSIEGRRF
jgi:hypothetical protein